MSDPELPFDATPPRTHRGDPATSHRAEARMRSSGTMGRHASLVYRAVCALPGLTATQLAAHLATEAALSSNEYHRRDQVKKRLSDLRLQGRVERGRGEGRECRWFPR